MGQNAQPPTNNEPIEINVKSRLTHTCSITMPGRPPRQLEVNGSKTEVSKLHSLFWRREMVR